MLEEKLCSCCRTVISTNDKLHHDHHVSAQDLFASAAGGCPLCAILCDCFHHSKFQKKVVDGEIVKLNFVIGDTFLTGTTAAAIRFTVCFPHHPRGKKALPLQHFLQHILVIPVDGKNHF